MSRGAAYPWPGSGLAPAMPVLLAMLVLGLALLLSAVPAHAAVLDGPFEVRTAYVTVDAGVYLLNARTDYPVNDEIRAALADGVTLYFDLDVRVERQRRLWFDAGVAAVTLRRELAYHAVRERYVLRHPARGEQDFFIDLDAALEALGTVTNYPVITEPQLESDGQYEIAVRAGMRRGAMPDALRALIWWSDSWHRETAWYAWSLPR